MQDDRRRYFRISDRMGVAYRPLNDAEPDSGAESSAEQRLAHCDAQIENLLEALAVSAPEIEQLGRLLNQKLDWAIAQGRDNQAGSSLGDPNVHSVNISACGMGFRIDEPEPLGAQLDLELLMLPERQSLSTRAEVVACEPTEEEGHYYARLEFVDMDSRDQEELIQHIVRRQSEILRRTREEGEQG